MNFSETPCTILLKSDTIEQELVNFLDYKIWIFLKPPVQSC